MLMLRLVLCAFLYVHLLLRPAKATTTTAPRGKDPDESHLLHSARLLNNHEFRSVESGRVLVIHPVYAGSHILAIRKILEALVDRGHEIHVIRWKESSRIPVFQHPKVKETILSVDNQNGSIPFMTIEKEAEFVFPDSLMWQRGLNPFAVFDGGMSSAAAACDAMLGNKQLIMELEEAGFKLAIVDLIFNECGLALANYLNLPVIAYWGLSFVSGETQYTTAFNSPAAIPHLYLPFTDSMNFLERFANFFYGIGSHLVMQVHFLLTNHYICKHLPGVPHPSQMISELSGLLINSHWAFDYPKQLPPTFLQIGGFHIREPQHMLPKEIQDIFSEADEEGVILFVLGKNFDSKNLPQEVHRSFFGAFSELKQKVIVKSNRSPEIVPSNVKVFKYLPQGDILAHPKTVAFVTHCGLHSVMEAIHYGVKMVALPIFFDQGNVAVRLVQLGIATRLTKTPTKEEIRTAISDVLYNRSYEMNIQRISQMYHSSPVRSLDKALWLVEHALRHNGTDHLKLSSKNLNFVQFFCLDILLFYFSLLFFLAAATWKLFKAFHRSFCCSSSHSRHFRAKKVN